VATGTRRYFIVVEGLYANRGDICPLSDVLRVARRYRVRIILDDSLAFGVLGKRGRGTAEHFGIDREATPLPVPPCPARAPATPLPGPRPPAALPPLRPRSAGH